MIKKVFRQMLLTQILSAMTVMICMLVDSIMIGRFLGVDQMTAYGLATPVLLVFAAFGTTLSAGIQVMCGKTLGSGDMDATNQCYTISFTVTAAVSALGVAIVLIFTSPVCVMLGTGDPSPDNRIFLLTRDYIRGFIIGAPAFIFAQIMVPFMQLSGKRVRLIAAVIAMTLSDIVFDILNVFVFKGDTFGMGLASSLSYYIAFFICISCFLGKNCIFAFKITLFRLKKLIELLRYSVPTVINQLSLVLLVFVMNMILLNVGGNRAVAVYSVISTVGNICFCFGSGVGSVALLLSSLFYSDEEKTELYQLIKTIVFYAAVLSVILIGVVFVLAKPLAELFLADAAAIGMAIAGLRIFSLSFLPAAMNTALKNYYQGINRTGLTQTISVMQNFLFAAIFAFALSRFMGTAGVWLAFVCGDASTLFFISAFVWIKTRKPSLSARAYSLLPDNFGSSEGDYLEMTLYGFKDAADASIKAKEFCAAHGVSEKTADMISLCIKEMSDNIVKHGFTKDAKKHSIDLRIVLHGKKRVIRIRDNCVNFDPVSYLKLHEADDPAEGAGIRMVMRLAKRANYVNSLGLNNLTLEF